MYNFVYKSNNYKEVVQIQYAFSKKCIADANKPKIQFSYKIVTSLLVVNISR